MDKEDDDKTRVIVAEELELLSSVLGMKDESCKLTARAPCMIIEVMQRAIADQPSSIYKIVFEIRPGYPSSAPNISIHAGMCKV